jgi:succinate dehydrogenase/fumarate reductase flavoprotein subunit
MIYDGAFDESFDVIVIGFGFGGAATAIEAHDRGAQVLLIEKMPHPGGITPRTGRTTLSLRNFCTFVPRNRVIRR